MWEKLVVLKNVKKLNASDLLKLAQKECDLFYDMDVQEFEDQFLNSPYAEWSQNDLILWAEFN